MRYSEAYRYINSFTNYEQKPGLASDLGADGLFRVHLLMRLLGRPYDGFKSIVIAGTKGKGSVAALIDSALRAAGYKTGLYTSPHLHTFRERIRVDGQMIPASEVARLTAAIEPVVERIHGLQDPSLLPTTYEIATAIAFLYFQQSKVDIAVLEVGLGGRLDAVNVVNPLVSVITSISLDHMNILGNTITEIAREKAGIIKPGGRVVTAPQVPEAMSVLTRVAKEQKANLVQVGKQIFVGTDHLPEVVLDDEGVPTYQAFSARIETEVGRAPIKVRIMLPLLGSHQQVNATVALATLLELVHMGVNVSREAVLRGFADAQWPGRMEVIHRHPLVVVDGAHNVDSFLKLHQAMADLFHRHSVVMVLGFSSDKDLQGILTDVAGWTDSILFGPRVERVIVTRAKHLRAADPQDVFNIATSLKLPVEIRETVPEALVRAEILAEVARRTEEFAPIVLVTGSLFVVAEARQFYGLMPDLSEEKD